MPNNKKSNKNKIIPIALAAIITSVGVGAASYVTATHADTTTAGTTTTASKHVGIKRPGFGQGIHGTVTAINGNSITLTGGSKYNATTTYTVDATNAKIMKMPIKTTPPVRPIPTVISVSQIQVGDTLMVQGTVNGSSVTATSILDGTFGGRGPGFGGRGAMKMNNKGRTGVRGAVTAISGNTLTVSSTAHGSSTVAVYTVDATNAKISKFSTTKGTAPATITVSGIAVGDTVMVRGTVSGTSVAATEIMDGQFKSK
jgi:hypothetical protein